MRRQPIRSANRKLRKSVRRRGLTVIELMTALTISSLLVGALLAVTAGVARSVRASKDANPYEASAFAFQRQLQSEYAASRDIHPQREQLRIEGYFKTTAQGVHHRPTEVIYEVKLVNGSRCLIRREIDLLAEASVREEVEMVCRDFSHFEYYSRKSTSNSPPQFELALFRIDSSNAKRREWFRTVLVRHGAESAGGAQ